MCIGVTCIDSAIFLLSVDVDVALHFNVRESSYFPSSIPLCLLLLTLSFPLYCGDKLLSKVTVMQLYRHQKWTCSAVQYSAV